MLRIDLHFMHNLQPSDTSCNMISLLAHLRFESNILHSAILILQEELVQMPRDQSSVNSRSESRNIKQLEYEKSRNKKSTGQGSCSTQTRHV